MKLIPILAIAVLALPCAAQTASKAEVFSGDDLAKQFATLVQSAKASGSSGATLGDYNSHAIKLSVRTSSGGAEVHAQEKVTHWEPADGGGRDRPIAVVRRVAAWRGAGVSDAAASAEKDRDWRQG